MKHIGKHLGAQELGHAVRLHELWLASREQDGRQLRLSGVTISNHDLGGKRLSRAILEEVNFQDTSFRETQLGGSCLSLTNFDACDLGEARLSHAQLHEVRIHKCSCVGAVLGGAEYHGVTFSDSDLSKSNMAKIILRGCTLSSASLELTTMHKGVIEDTTFTETSFEFAELSKSHFYRCKLKDCSLQDAVLHKAGFFDTVMTRVHGTPREAESLSIKNVTLISHDGTSRQFDRNEVGELLTEMESSAR